MSDEDVANELLSNVDGQSWVLQAARLLRFGKFTIEVTFADGKVTLLAAEIKITRKPAPQQAGGAQ